jgi:hypothetical protein
MDLIQNNMTNLSANEGLYIKALNNAASSFPFTNVLLIYLGIAVAVIIYKYIIKSYYARLYN